MSHGHSQSSIATPSVALRRGACNRFSVSMAKKRKSENAALDEVERSLYTSFCTAANSISQLYTQAQNQQKIAFQAGERHGVEKLYHWLLREHQNGSNITVAQIIHNLQTELENGSGDEMTMSPGPQIPVQQQPSVVGTSGRTAALPTPLDQGKISVFQGALSSPNRRSIPAFAMAPGGYGVHSTSVQPARRGSLSLEQPTADLREDQLESAPAIGFGFQPPQPQAQHHHHHHQQPNQHQQHSQHARGGAHTYNENDASMDMHADGAAEGYYR